jgi:hypothetical protein
VVILKIDETPEYCNICSKEEFIKDFQRLGEKAMTTSDNGKYWVLYDEGCDAFWCISATEVTFFLVDDEYHLVKDPVTDAMEKLLSASGITLDEDEENEELPEDYNRYLKLYSDFEHKLGAYILNNLNADEDVFRFYKGMRKWTNTPTDPDTRDDNKVCFITYLEEFWYAWMQSILDETFEYMNLASIVWESWERV